MLMFPPMQNVSSFIPIISDNLPSVNQEDHDDDDYDCDPAYEDCTTDSDGDGVPDWDDDCPNESGTYENYGCPDGVTHVDTDSDGDGWYDDEDDCPNTPGQYNGCPDDPNDPDGDGIVNDYDDCPNTHGGANEVRGCPDSDADGVADINDQCPSEQEDWMGPTDGCPTANDSDNDGIPDDQDNCPNTGNQDQADFNNDGNGDVCSDADGDGYYDSFDQCPLEYAYADPNDDGCLDDTDGDGVPDETDQCPNEPGNVNGCPAPTDTDNDGVPDSSDSCPNEFGTQSNGCPVPVVTDSDNDGVPDSSDSCPNEFGTQSNGCPVPVVTDSDNDGVPDYNDLCIYEYGPSENAGCPVDDDYGGYSSWDAFCQGEFGSGTYYDESLDGCYDIDYDGDGIPDDQDSCPNEFGTQSNGCPVPVVTDSDGDGIPDNEDACPNQPEDNWTYDPVDGCPESGGNGTELTIDKVPAFSEYLNYHVEGYLKSSSGEGLAGKQVTVSFFNTDTNSKVTSDIVTTDSTGLYSATAGGGSFPGNHVLTVSFTGGALIGTVDDIKFPVEVSPLSWPFSCTSEELSGGIVCDIFRLNAMFKENKITSPGTVQYGDEFQAIGYNFRYGNPDNMLISIYNPCDELIHKSPIIIHTTMQFWPKFVASGQGWNISGVYKLIAHHENSGNYVAETTFTVQSSGPFVSSPSDSQCTAPASGSGSWKGQVAGYGTLHTEYNTYVYSIDGTFNFDVLDNGEIKGSGISGVEISKTYGYVDSWGNPTYSCWSIDNKPKSISFSTKGKISGGEVHMYLSDGSPGDLWLTIWCDIPGYHQDVQKVYDPFNFDSYAVLDLKQGAKTTTTTDGPYADKGGYIDWTFKITQEGELDPKFSSEPPKPVPTKPKLVAPKPIPAPTPPPQATPAPPPKTLPPQAPAPTPIPPSYVPPTPYVPPTNPYVPPTTPTTPTAPINLITLSVDTDRTTYNQGNLVTINTDIDGATNNANIAISVIDPSGNVVMTRTLFTDDKGSIPFKVSHGTIAGSYKVTASVNIDGQNYEDTSQFTIKKDLAGLSIKSVSATNQQGNPVDSFSQGNQGHIKIVTSADSFMSNSLVTVTILDSDFIALGTSSIKTSISSGESEIILSYYIPDDTSVGVANIYVNAFTDWPSNGGIPLTRESSAQIGIGVAIPPPTISPTIDASPSPVQPSPVQPSPVQPSPVQPSPVQPSVQTSSLKTVTIPSGTGSPGCERANLCYFPSTIVINQGGSIEWNNKDGAAHTVTSGNPSDGPDSIFDSSLFMGGEKYKADFNTKGTFEYFCMVHPWMEGKVIVK